MLEEIAQLKDLKNRQKAYTLPSPKERILPSLIVTTAALAVIGSSLFLMAYFKVMPQGVNCISELKPYGFYIAIPSLFLATGVLLGLLPGLLKKPDFEDYKIIFYNSPRLRRHRIQHMSKKEFFRFCFYLFTDSSGKKHATPHVINDLKTFSNWEQILSSHKSSQPWIATIKQNFLD